MECCVGVSTEIVLQIINTLILILMLAVLQIVKFYTVVERVLKLTFRTVVLRRSECMRDK